MIGMRCEGVEQTDCKFSTGEAASVRYYRATGTGQCVAFYQKPNSKYHTNRFIDCQHGADSYLCRGLPYSGGCHTQMGVLFKWVLYSGAIVGVEVAKSFTF